jgi:D-sedoheptulose 7-phosphate isomerase
MKISIKKRLDLHEQAISTVLSMEDKIVEIQKAMGDCLNRGGRIMACGNGGSAAEAQHFMTELSGRYRGNRKALAGIALVCDGTALSCIGNDFGWDTMYSRQVEAVGRAGDIFFGISTSGNSPNVIQATKRANELGLLTVGLLGKDGGKMKDIVKHRMIVDLGDTGAIQEIHLVLIHMLCEAFEEDCFGD